MDVHVNHCLDNIVAGGVQICGLHATVAPRRQQQQSPPTLEEFVFVPYVDTECLASNGKLAQQLRLCKGTIDKPIFVAVSLFITSVDSYNFGSFLKLFKINI